MRLTPPEVLDHRLDELSLNDSDCKIGVAVSGGSDSLALLILTQAWAKRAGHKVLAATVDHKLRPEAAQEIAHVAQVCADLGVHHDVMHWVDWDGTGNLQARARSARMALLEEWRASNGASVILLGHTADDQAETVLLNLARGSGVDGLAGITIARGKFYRPLLDVTRKQLRDVLTEARVNWCDDPSNDDPRFDRVKARQMMGHLAELGLTRDRLLQTSKHMRHAQISLTNAAADFARENVQQIGGDLLLEKRVFCDIADGKSEEPLTRVVASALMWIGRQSYKPRYAALCDMAQAVSDGQQRTLHGVRIVPEGERVRLSREGSAVNDILTGIDGAVSSVCWDGRWEIKGRFAPDLTIRALGGSVSLCPQWREIGLPRASLMATPAVFDGDRLISAPVAGLNHGFETRIVADFMSFLLSR